MKIKTIIAIAIPVFIIGTVVVLSNMDFAYSVIEDDLMVTGLITNVSSSEIILENGRVYNIEEKINYESDINEYTPEEEFAVGNYLSGIYKETNQGNFITEINVNHYPTFSGTILSVDNFNAVVVPNENEYYIRSSADQVYVALPTSLELNVGDTVNIEYNGRLSESYPLQIVTNKVNGVYLNQ